MNFFLLIFTRETFFFFNVEMKLTAIFSDVDLNYRFRPGLPVNKNCVTFTFSINIKQCSDIQSYPKEKEE